MTILLFQSCSNIISSKVPQRFVSNISSNIKFLGPTLLNKYHSNIIIKVDSISDHNLKQQLTNLEIEYFQVLYNFDSSFYKPYQVKFRNPTNSDSIIILGKIKDMQRFSLSSWRASFEVEYFFGKDKPKIKYSKDEFKNVIKKINDSIYFIRTNFPNH